ncbi:MAG TPA: RsmD family RNA methyltransferase [Vicinamibacterales bacterium]|jgi:23S rRNA (uracil1939-C5)-methyltransferase
MIAPGATITVEALRVTGGGRMFAVHDGKPVFLWGALPGERVDARVVRVSKGVVSADTIAVHSPSPDRRPVSGDWRCGGNVLAHVQYAAQLRLKGQIIEDAFRRIGKIPLPAIPEVLGSPEEGYRMRARLHAHKGRLGFYREGSHDLCDAAATRQLLPSTNEWIAHAQDVLRRDRLDDVTGIEIAENITGDERACHVELSDGREWKRCAALGEGLVGLSVRAGEHGPLYTVSGTPVVHDVIDVGDATVRLRRDARAFFQGNRFLVNRLVTEVVARAPRSGVVDLYAGGGLIGLALAAAGAADVALVEGDQIAALDLEENAKPYPRAHVMRRSVEEYLKAGGARGAEVVIVDPPRTGLSTEAVNLLAHARPRSCVYVSCDPATLARDASQLVSSGYRLDNMIALDLFPNTAHVETVAVFSRSA